jgi:chromosome segregation ATPase
MEEKLVEILTMLEYDLKDIDTAVKHISRAEDAAVAVIDSNDKFINAIKENLHELQKGIKTVVKELTEDTDTLVIKWEELNEKHTALTDRLAKLTTYFESVNFPARLDKIDTSISSVNQGIQANQNLLNDLYRRMDQHAEKQSEYSNQFIKQANQLKTIAIIILGLVCIGTALGLIGILI